MEEVQLVLKRIMTQKKTTTRKKVAHLEQVFISCHTFG